MYLLRTESEYDILKVQRSKHKHCKRHNGARMLRPFIKWRNKHHKQTNIQIQERNKHNKETDALKARNKETTHRTKIQEMDTFSSREVEEASSLNGSQNTELGSKWQFFLHRYHMWYRSHVRYAWLGCKDKSTELTEGWFISIWCNFKLCLRTFQEKGWISGVGKCAKVETHSSLSNWLMLQHHALLLIECWTSESPCLLDAFCLLCKQIPSFGPFFEWAWPGQSTGRGFEAVTRMHFLDPGLSSVLSSTVGQIEFLLKQKFYNITCQFHKWGVST